MNRPMTTMSPSLRKFTLTTHLTSSVGWLAAVASFLALAVAGLTSREPELVRAAYFGMKLIAWFVIVPLSIASPLTGIIQSLGTRWGLFRHYWVFVKFLITIPSTIILLLHMQPVSRMASVVAMKALPSAELRGVRIQLVASAAAASMVLLVATVLSVYKPWGMIKYGHQGLHQPSSVGSDSTALEPGEKGTPAWLRVFQVLSATMILLILLLHLAGYGLGGH